MQFEIPFFGHSNVRAYHNRTIEITTEPDLSLRGDCIVGVRSVCGCKEIPNEIKQKLQSSQSKVRIIIKVDNEEFVIEGQGHEDLKLENPHDIVIRKSSFVCPRTLAINCDKSSNDIPRKMIKKLQSSDTEGLFVVEII